MAKVTFNLKHKFVWIALLGAALVALIALGVEGLPSPLATARLLLGLAYVLFVPGYALQAALFPRREEIDGAERLALSLGLSIALVPVVALILHNLPWGIRLWPVVAGEALVIVACSVVAWWRQRRLAPQERAAIIIGWDIAGWWSAQGRIQRILYGLLAGALLLAVVSATAILVLPRPGEHLTEFYILGSEGLAEDYPREAVAGQPLTVAVGITNREGVEAEYWVEVRDGNGTIGGAGPLRLAPGATEVGLVAFTPTEMGDDVQVTFALYRDGGTEPYRSLRLWIASKAAP